MKAKHGGFYVRIPDYAFIHCSLSASAGMRDLGIGVEISGPTQDSKFHDQLSNY
jgi:hypothetical protein